MKQESIDSSIKRQIDYTGYIYLRLFADSPVEEKKSIKITYHLTLYINLIDRCF